MLLSEDMIPALKALNDKVSAIISKEVAHSKTNKVSVGPDIVAAQKPSSILWAGAPIYVNRFKPLVFYGPPSRCTASPSPLQPWAWFPV